MASTINAQVTPIAGVITTADTSGALNIQTGGTTAIAIDSSQNVTISGIPTNSTYGNIKALLETATITAAAPSATTNFDAKTQAVQYYTTNAANNWTLNVRGDSSTTLNSIMATGQSLTIAVVTTQGATPYYASALTIDGNAVTPKYQGGTAWTSGNASGLDAYTYTIIKTASATFTVLAAQTQFK